MNMVCALDMSKSSAGLHRCVLILRENKEFTFFFQCSGSGKEIMHSQRRLELWPRFCKTTITTNKSLDSFLGPTGEESIKEVKDIEFVIDTQNTKF